MYPIQGGRHVYGLEGEPFNLATTLIDRTLESTMVTWSAAVVRVGPPSSRRSTKTYPRETHPRTMPG